MNHDQAKHNKSEENFIVDDLIKEGETLFSEGKIEEAEKSFLSLLKNDPANAAILNNLGVIYHTQDNIEKAEEFFLKTHRINRDYLDPLLNLVDLYQNAKRWKEAVLQLMKCIAIDDQDPNLYNQLGMIYLEMGDFQKAREVLAKSYKLNPYQDILRQSLIALEKRDVSSRDFKKERVKVEALSSDAHSQQIPLVSVLIASRNRAPMLDNLLKDLHTQKYNNYEIVIVNDHSTDNTQEVIHRWISSDLNIHHIENTNNIGGASSFYKAFMHSKGDYVLLLSDDDMIKPYALKKMVETARRKNADIVYCDIGLIDDTGNQIGRWSYESYQDYRALLTKLIITASNCIPETPLMTRNAFEQYKMTYTDRFIPIYYLMNLRKTNFAYIPEPLYQYRIHPNSVASNMEGMWQRNNAVINFINAIVFMYSFAEIFPGHDWPKEKASLATGYATIAKILYQSGRNFIEGRFYNGLTYKKEDGLFLLFYKYAYMWLKRSICYGAAGQDVEFLLGELRKNVSTFVCEDLNKKCSTPTCYDILPPFALLPYPTYNTLVALDVLVFGKKDISEQVLINEEAHRQIIVKFHQVAAADDLEKDRDYLLSNLVHVLVAKGAFNGGLALKLLDELGLFSIPVIIFLSNNDNNVETERLKEILAGGLSPVTIEYLTDDSAGSFLGLKGLTMSMLFKKVKEVWEIRNNFEALCSHK